MGQLLSFEVCHSFWGRVPNLGVVACFWRVSSILGQIQSFWGKLLILRRLTLPEGPLVWDSILWGHCTHFGGEFFGEYNSFWGEHPFWGRITHFTEKLAPFGSSFGSEERPSFLETITHFGASITPFGVVCNTLGKHHSFGGRIHSFLENTAHFGVHITGLGVYHSFVGKILLELIWGEKVSFLVDHQFKYKSNFLHITQLPLRVHSPIWGVNHVFEGSFAHFGGLFLHFGSSPLKGRSCQENTGATPHLVALYNKWPGINTKLQWILYEITDYIHARSVSKNRHFCPLHHL